MNRVTLISTLLGLRSWASSGTALTAKLTTALNLALRKFSMDAPSAFYPAEEHALLYADATTSSTTFYLKRTTDTWVLEFVDASGNPYPSILTTQWVPDTTGIWNSLMHVEVKDENGRWHRRQSRDFFRVLAPPFYHHYVSFDRPFPSGTNSAVMEFRIYQPRFYTRDDVLRVESCMAWDGNNVKATPVSAGSADLLGMVDYQGNDTGLPENIVNAEHFQLPAPNFVPTLTEDNKTPWVGPESEGTFTFVYTYVRGKRDDEWQESESLAYNDPLWESAQSPTSASVTHAGTPTGSIHIELPNVDWMNGYGDVTTLRYARSGWRKRIYVARTAISPTTGTVTHIESAGVYYLLAEVGGEVTRYTWDGSVIPDYSRRLRTSTGYYAWRVWPHQDQQYELDLRVARAAEDLVTDTDTPRVKPQGVPILMELALYFACLQDGVDVESANFHLSNYQQRELPKLLAELAGRGGAILPTSWSGGVNTARRNLGTFYLD